MEKDVKELLEWLEQKDEFSTFWDIVSLCDNAADIQTLKKIFPNEAQFRFIKAIVKKLDGAYDFHDSPDSEAHLDIQTKIDGVAEKLRNHRHDFSKSYCGKAEV